MEPYDPAARFFRLIKQTANDCIFRDDFLPYIKELLSDHPGLEFLSNHAEFQEKYAVTVIARIFYSVNKCHSGRITLRQIRRSDLLEAFQQVDDEEDINKVTRYFSYEHFYVLYCRFWELDHDRDYRITREDLLKYGDHSLSHMIVDRIFDAAPRPFGKPEGSKDFLGYEDFIFFMLSEEDKSNEVSVRYWFSCVDVDGDGKLNNMEMRSFYAVQLHRMQCMGHEIVPFEDMLCQMMDMIKPTNPDFLVEEDFLKPECCQVSGALFDALFNLNKYLMFEQRDPFVERQKREDEFETDWDRFACMDYNRLAMEEEAREEEAMEIDWVNVDDEEDSEDFNSAAGLGGVSEAPF
uniref:EF-hand domain-containing protein n=1 Tax=Cyclophora tenuis TaxID=216820 RepID=A0A7S1D7L1_CYCTE